MTSIVKHNKAHIAKPSAGLYRHRRNLILICLLLPLYFFAGADIDKLKFFNIIITIKNTFLIKSALTMLFLFFIGKYWQYYHKEAYVKNMHCKLNDYLLRGWENFFNENVRKRFSIPRSDCFNLYCADSVHSKDERKLAIADKKDRYIFPFWMEGEFYISSSENQQNYKKCDSIMAEPNNSGWVAMRFSDKKDRFPTFSKQNFRYNIVWFNILMFIERCKFMSKELIFVDFQLPLYLASVSAMITIAITLI